jgi:predicted O-methyltransferase YrrM
MTAVDYPRLLDGLTKAIADYYIVEGGSFQIKYQVDRLRELVAASSPKSIMEIGFNAGHSALLFLAITPPETKVVSFDLGEYAYVFAAKRYIDSVFPGRHTLVTGDSTVIIPKYEEQVAHRMKNPLTAPPLRFDFIFIDGGHQDDVPMKDILNSKRLAAGNHTIVAVDDICRVQQRHAHYTIEPTRAWDQMVSVGIVDEHGFDDYYELLCRDNIQKEEYRSRGMVWGRYSHSTPSAASSVASSVASIATARYHYHQSASKYMDRNQMLQEIHNQYHYHKDQEKLVAISDMYLDYFPLFNKRDTNYVRFYRACANFVLNPSVAIQQFEEIVDTPSPTTSAATNSSGINDSDSELPDFIKESSVANLGMLYPADPCSHIPKIIHLLYFGETEFYNFHHRCISSMIMYMPEYEIRIYNAREPPAENQYWQDIRNHRRVRIIKMTPPDYYDGFELKHFQYKADVARLELLYEHGGVYLDIDMLIVRPFHEIFESGERSFYISEEREGATKTRGSGPLINAFLAAKPKNGFIKLWLNAFKSGLRLGIWAHHIRDSNKQLLEQHPHYMHKYRICVLDWKRFMPLHWQDTERFILSETVPFEFPPESYGTHLWETILGDVMRKNEFLRKQKDELDMLWYADGGGDDDDNDDDLTIYPEYFHPLRSDQYVDKYITKGKHHGYFVNIGAKDYSATHFFERYREWSGLCIESVKQYETSLYALCCQNSAPEYIDYCSVSCEGSEYDILSAFFEETRNTSAIEETIADNDGIRLMVLNKCFTVDFFSIRISSDILGEQVRELMTQHHYIETVNPYLAVIDASTEDKRRMKYFRRSMEPDAATVDVTDAVSAAATACASFLHQPPFAEEVVVLCLHERPERTKYVTDHLNSHGVKHTVLLNHLHTEDTKVGCFRSHINAIRYAQQRNLSSVLILEDDIRFRENIRDLATLSLPLSASASASSSSDPATATAEEDWDILYLGGILTKYDGMDSSRSWVKGTVWCNHAYLVKQRMYSHILELVDTFPNLIELERRNIDYMYTEYIQPKYNCWLANDQYIIQKEGYSEIDGRVKWANGFDWSTFSMKFV